MEVALVLVGGLVGILGSLLAEQLRHRAAERTREAELADRQRADDRDRFEEVYRHASAGLLTTGAALRRLHAAIIYFENYGRPINAGSISAGDQLIAAVSDLGRAEALVSLFGSNDVARAYGEALEIASHLREDLDEAHEWDSNWLGARFDEFNRHSETALRLMRRDLESVRT